MLKNRGVRRVCGNIYGCAQAARFIQASSLSLDKDRCGSCSAQETYPEFMQHGLILSCRMCAQLSGSDGGQFADGLGDCFQRLGRHCPLCAFEYKSLAGKDHAWIKSASEILRCFLGGSSRHQLAEKLYGLLTKVGCGNLETSLYEILAMLDEKRQNDLTRRIREASLILKIDLLMRKLR